MVLPRQVIQVHVNVTYIPCPLGMKGWEGPFILCFFPQTLPPHLTMRKTQKIETEGHTTGCLSGTSPNRHHYEGSLRYCESPEEPEQL